MLGVAASAPPFLEPSQPNTTGGRSSRTSLQLISQQIHRAIGSPFLMIATIANN
jgi:hypothetical protein